MVFPSKDDHRSKMLFGGNISILLRLCQAEEPQNYFTCLPLSNYMLT